MKDPTASDWRYCPLCRAELTAPIAMPGPAACPQGHFTAWRNPLPGTVTIIHDEAGRILVGRRGAGHFQAGRWCLPGGYIELGEDYMSAAIREVREETGLTIEPSGVYSVVSNRFDNGRETLVVVLLAFVSGNSSQNPGDDLDQLAWLGSGDLLPPFAFQADLMAIRRFWSGDLAIISKNPEFFSAGAGI